MGNVSYVVREYLARKQATDPIARVIRYDRPEPARKARVALIARGRREGREPLVVMRLERI